MANFSWLNEEVSSVNNRDRIYKLICFFIRRKLTYKELYIILSNLNKKKLGSQLSKEKALEKVVEIYKKNNNKLPNFYENDDK